MSNLTNADISNYELINSNELGPFTLNEWIEYNNINKLYTNNLLDNKLLILTTYPRIKFINILINEYKKNEDTGIRKLTYKITQHVPNKPILDKNTKSKNSREQSYKISNNSGNNNSNNSGNNTANNSGNTANNSGNTANNNTNNMNGKNGNTSR